MVSPVERRQVGLGLVEMMLATVVGAIVLLSLGSVTGLAMNTSATVHSSNELMYQGRFAIERMAARARSLAPRELLGSLPTNSTGNWLAPSPCSGSACTMYCLRVGAKQLIETVTSDTACLGVTGFTVIAQNVTAFAARVPVWRSLPDTPEMKMGALDRQAIVLTLTLKDGEVSQTMTAQVRLGGGTQ